ncbi:galanin receptor 2a-like [Oculina patagonica]
MISETGQAVITTILCTFAIVDIIGNTLVCIVIIKNQDMRIPINLLLVNLAVADMMVATFFIPFHVLIHTFNHPDGVLGRVLCSLVTGGGFAWVGGACSAFTLVVIAFERYYAVNYPHGNRGKLTNAKLKVIIPVSWIFALIMESPGFLSSDYNQMLGICIMDFSEEWMGKAFSVLWFLVFGGLPIPLMLALYSSVVYNLWFKRNDQNELSFQQKGVLKVRKRVTLTAVTVSIIFSICWLADAIIFLMSYHSTTNSPSDVTWAIAAVMILFNSAVNPFVYALINQRFKEKLKGLFGCIFRPSNQIDVDREVPDIQQPTNNSTLPTQSAE